METKTQEPLLEVLSNYDINVRSTRTETYKDKKAVWWVETDQGLMVLKKISNSEQTLKYIISAINHLSKNGILLPPIIKTKDGTDYVTENETCYVLSGAIKGKSPSYDSENELDLIIRELAKFHRASVGFSVIEDTKPKIHLGTWEERLTAEIEDMNVFYHSETGEAGEIGKFIINEFPYFYERAWSAIKSLDSNDYKAWVMKARQQGSLCHQDFAAGNLLIDSSNRLYVLDTDGITLDIAARDIRKILCKIMKRIGKWDVELTKRIINFYQQENPLLPSEWRVVKSDLLYPHLFVGAMNKYYYRRDKEWSDEKYFKRIKEMSSFEKTIQPVIDNFDSLIPH